MTTVIWKYTLSNSDICISMPKDSKILFVEKQRDEICIWRDEICIWVEVDPDKQLEKRNFEVFTTGVNFDCEGLIYIDTVLLYSESLVFHIYERADES